MENEKAKRITHTHRLAADQIVKEQEVRRKVQEEFPPAPRVTEPVPQTIADSLKQAIRESGRSDNQISKDSGIAQIVIARFLSGEKDIRMATAQKLARALKLQLTTG
jgi:hypothetical protein